MVSSLWSKGIFIRWVEVSQKALGVIMVKNKWGVVVAEVELEFDFGKAPRNRYHIFGTDTTEIAIRSLDRL
jgi:hypothetical protein